MRFMVIPLVVVPMAGGVYDVLVVPLLLTVVLLSALAFP